MQAMTPITPLEPGVEMFQRAKTQSFFFPPRTQSTRPLSEATEIDTDFEDDSSDFEEDSPKYSFDSTESRRSQTTLSSFDEVVTPQSNDYHGFIFKPQQMRDSKPVEGPRGPHLFRSSQASSDFAFEYALQMSPLFPKEMNLEVQVQTPATIIAPRQQLFSSIGNAIASVDNFEVSQWTAQQVASWMYKLGFEETVIDKFEAHDITGQVLLDMQFEDLRELDITSFGKRHQLWAHIESLRDNDGRISPAPTPFHDLSRPATAALKEERKRDRSKSRQRKRERSRKRDGCEGEELDAVTPITPGGSKLRRGRKHRNPHDDIITPAESVSIVAIEQLLPKPHKCAKGERCAKWRKQQRQLERLQVEHGFPISPEKGGHIFIAGDPGNAGSTNKVVENVVWRPTSENVPSIVASSAALAPEHMPEISLQEEMLQYIESRDPQDNVRQFLSLQGFEPPEMCSSTPIECHNTPPLDLFPPLQRPEQTQAPHVNLRSLPRLAIPRSASANPEYHATRSANVYENEPESAFSACHTALSPIDQYTALYRYGTPATEMDVPLTAIPQDPFSRDNSQSVPPNMQFREQTMRTTSRVDWRRPSFAMPALQEGQVFSPVSDEPRSAFPRNSTSSTLQGSLTDAPEPSTPTDKVYSKSASNSPNTSPQASKPIKVVGHDLRPPNTPTASSPYHYVGVTHAGWMKKRRTKLLRHEWHDAHFRLNGTTLSQHANALPSCNPLSAIDVDDYAVACSSLASNKLAAKLRSLKITSGQTTTPADAAFSFQLVPAAPEGYGNFEARKKAAGGKTHHFAVKTRDERIDWMRELMLAKALRAKGDGYEVQVNGTAM